MHAIYNDTMPTLCISSTALSVPSSPVLHHQQGYPFHQKSHALPVGIIRGYEQRRAERWDLLVTLRSDDPHPSPQNAHTHTLKSWDLVNHQVPLDAKIV